LIKKKKKKFPRWAAPASVEIACRKRKNKNMGWAAGEPHHKAVARE
jgi:hypothetical protein